MKMKLYELTYLISPQLSENEVKTFQEKVVSLIQKEGGILNEINLPKKESLAYPIKKNEAAYLANLSFQLLPERLKNLEKRLKSEEKILRYLLLTKKLPKKIVPIGVKKLRKEKPKKVELKEIEKKLEEILDQ